MRLQLTLRISGTGKLLPINYQYPLSAVIYKVLQRADARYAEFLHNQGYGSTGHQNFKLFTFSDLKTPFKIQGDRLLLTGSEATFIVCFHLPEAMENFVKGLFLQQEIEVADINSKVRFIVSQVEMQSNRIASDSLKDGVMLQPISPVVAGVKNGKGHYDYLAPADEAFASGLLYNWKEKYITVYGQEAANNDFSNVKLEIKNGNAARSRLITIKANTPEQTRIRGFVGFTINVHAPADALELVMNAGCGLYNAQGMGCVEMK